MRLHHVLLLLPCESAFILSGHLVVLGTHLMTMMVMVMMKMVMVMTMMMMMMANKRSKTIGDILLHDSGAAFKAGIKSQF